MSKPWRIGLVLTCTLILVAGCSQVKIGYSAAGFLIGEYADDYLDLTAEQERAWQPRLERVLATHRREELPRLAGFAEALAQTGGAGFPPAETRCLVEAFPPLYRDHARLAVSLAAPLLAALGPAQVDRLQARFAKDAADDRPELDSGGRERLQRKRAKRYVESIEDWTGDLSESQRLVVSRGTDRMPDTVQAVYDYRERKRAELIDILRQGADESRIHGFLSRWLVEYQDLPPDLAQARGLYADRLTELLSSLGQVLDPAQRERLSNRFMKLRDDLMSLHGSGRIDPVSC